MFSSLTAFSVNTFRFIFSVFNCLFSYIPFLPSLVGSSKSRTSWNETARTETEWSLMWFYGVESIFFWSPKIVKRCDESKQDDYCLLFACSFLKDRLVISNPIFLDRMIVFQWLICENKPVLQTTADFIRKIVRSTRKKKGENRFPLITHNLA